MPTGNLNFPIRHAGQYYDQEVNLFYNYFRDYDPITGRYVESDPIGLQGGLNTYGYVSANPLLKIDPRGLIEWSAMYGETGSGLWRIGPSYKVIHFIFKSKCINNKKATVSVIARGVGLSGGSSPAFSLGAGSATFYDSYNDINPNVFNGDFRYSGISYLFSASKGKAQVGGAVRTTSASWGYGLHTDLASFELIRGNSMVKSIKMEDCCEN